jgi:hypothetical protein
VQLQRLANGAPLKMGSLSEGKGLTSSDEFLSSASKRAAVSALPGPDFEDLVARVHSAFAGGEKVEELVMKPQACRRWLDGERDRYVQSLPCLICCTKYWRLA